MGIFASKIFLLDIPLKRSCRQAMATLIFRWVTDLAKLFNGVNDPVEINQD
jgi:hypothetical protein